MKKAWIPWILLVGVIVSGQYMGRETGMHEFTYTLSTTITTTASEITPQASVTLRDGPRQVLLRAPSTNTDPIRVTTNGAATASSLPLKPGTEILLPFNDISISAIADSGTQSLEIIGFYR